ncbi:MAG: hypothetical protein MR740_08930, partial [Clostridium sp.]|nr:hypothetical protein [Clostridium sp.]
CTGKLTRRRGGHGQRQGGGGRHTRCGIPTDDNARCACVRPSEGLRFPRKLTVFSSKKKRRERFFFAPERKARPILTCFFVWKQAILIGLILS